MYLYMFSSASKAENGSPQHVAFFFPPEHPHPQAHEGTLFATSSYLAFGKGKTWSPFTHTGSRFILQRMRKMKWNYMPPENIPEELKNHPLVKATEYNEHNAGSWRVTSVNRYFVDELEELVKQAPSLGMQAVNSLVWRFTLVWAPLALFLYLMFG